MWGSEGERFDVWRRLRAEALWSNHFTVTDIDVCERVDHMHYWKSDTHFAQPHTSVWFSKWFRPWAEFRNSGPVLAAGAGWDWGSLTEQSGRRED